MSKTAENSLWYRQKRPVVDEYLATAKQIEDTVAQHGHLYRPGFLGLGVTSVERALKFKLSDINYEIVKQMVEHYYTQEDDALSKTWTGICWMNPPWTGHGDLKKWVTKAYEADAIVVCLLPYKPESGWWDDYCTKGEVREIAGENEFVGCKNGKPKKCAIVIFKARSGLPVSRKSLHSCPARRMGVL